MVFFSAATLMVVIPSTIQIYAWLFTVNMGRPTFDAPLLFIGGFILFFVFGGLSGIMFAAVPFDQAVTDTYFVVAHFHFIIFGAAVFPIFGGFYYWFPKVTGRLYHEPAAKLSFYLAFAGTALTFFPMHVVGLLGMPRRVYTYPHSLGWDGYNLAETVGAFLLAAGLLLIAANLAWSLRRGPRAARNPFNAPTLEWAATSPPQPYNFAQIPRVTSEYPLWDGCEPSGLVLDAGHEQPLSTTADGDLDAIAHMPSESAVPPILAVVFALFFTMLLTSHYVAALGFLALAALCAAAWNWHEPESAESPKSLPRGWWGIALLVASEATLLSCVFGSYWYLRFKSHAWPPAGIPEPKVLWPVVLTAILVATSVPMQLAARKHAPRFWLGLALAVQAAYFGIQIHLLLSDLSEFAPQQHAYASIYYVLVGASHFHVAVGLAINAFLFVRLASGLTAYRAVGLRAAAYYWHFVNAFTILILVHQISPRL
jgi:heme/copper-type cytochrome/quinol oxidase subunit 3